MSWLSLVSALYVFTEHVASYYVHEVVFVYISKSQSAAATTVLAAGDWLRRSCEVTLRLDLKEFRRKAAV